MYFHAGLILFVIAVSFGVAKALKLSVELSMLVAALAAAIVHSGGAIPVRHLVEGSFTYLDVCLIFITATFFHEPD